MTSLTNKESSNLSQLMGQNALSNPYPPTSQIKSQPAPLLHPNMHPGSSTGSIPIKEHFKVNYNDSLGRKLEDMKPYDQRSQKIIKNNVKGNMIFQSTSIQRPEGTDLFVTREISSTDQRPKVKNNPFKTTISDKPIFSMQKQGVNTSSSDSQEKKNQKQFFYASITKRTEKESRLNENVKKSNSPQKQPHIDLDKNEINLSNNNNLNIINQNNNDNIQPQKTFPKFKEQYLDLLIKSADDLIKGGLNLDELKGIKPQILPLQNESNHSNPIQSNNFFNFKCENKVCPVVVTKKSNIYQAKMGTLKNKILWLCSQCHQAWKNGQFCYYCGVIYREYRGTKGFNDHKSWIGCEYCKNWEHIQCEEAKGFYSNLSQLIKKDKHFKYKCPFCRKKEGLNGKEDGLLNNKRGREGEVRFKRVIKKKKEFDDNKTNEKNDIFEDIKKIIHLNENNK